MYQLIFLCSFRLLMGVEHTVNVDMFALFIFSRYSRLSNIRENMHIVKTTFIRPHRGKNIKNANINLCEIANFRKCAKINTRENIYVHSNLGYLNIRIYQFHLQAANCPRFPRTVLILTLSQMFLESIVMFWEIQSKRG